MSQQEFQLFISTAPEQAIAESLARQLVERKLAACVNLIPQVSSVYAWQGAIEKTQEVILLIKSTAEQFTAIEELLTKQHPYEIPELISCNIEQLSASYGQWLQTNINKA
ncbi:divalent-cation tolerance protein CutA [Kangiella sp. TOML190]|uniref:divalent-cation tolerance protein CutA n=1 Tax=Kangiella sp. TOML190 TaxID=2931351 RepID=UPI00203EF82F|nr:divalent-cation tolerance protein CutA [Kangiella sp. TOML190]